MEGLTTMSSFSSFIPQPAENLDEEYEQIKKAIKRRTKWKLLQRPECDLCTRIAIWKHPQGGLRCDVCPRPEE